MCALCATCFISRAQDGGHSGLDYSIGLGYDFMTSNESNDNGSPTASIAIGKQFNSSFYLGGRIGAHIVDGQFNDDHGDPKVYVPIMVDFRTYIPNGGRVTPFCDFGTGFIFNSLYDNNGESHHVGFNVMPGLSYNLSDQFALDVSGGYLHRFHVGGEAKGSKGYISFRIALRFHK